MVLFILEECSELGVFRDLRLGVALLNILRKEAGIKVRQHSSMFTASQVNPFCRVSR